MCPAVVLLKQAKYTAQRYDLPLSIGYRRCAVFGGAEICQAQKPRLANPSFRWNKIS